MSIRARLIIAIALLLSAGLLSMTAAVIIEAGPRVEEESESTARLTETLINSSLITIETAPDPMAVLDRLTANLRALRHVRVDLGSRLSGGKLEPLPPTSFWASLIGGADRPPFEIPVYVKGRLIDVLLVTPLPQDELQEVWTAIASILKYGALIAVILIPLTSLLITRSLAPIQDLTTALQELESGNYAVEIPETGPPEIALSCRRLNTLAKALSSSRDKVKELSSRIVKVQDEERREVVRELHDDLGPHLFALRARAAALERGLLKDVPDFDRALDDATAIAEHIDAVQQTNRRVLNRLVPAGLLELGLTRALTAMGATWRKEQPHVALSVTLPTGLDALGESTSLTIYRVCQEALTNAFRHAHARQIDLAITSDVTGGLNPTQASAATHGIIITVADDGRGPPEAFAFGRGLKGMSERVMALGGKLTLQSRPSGGTLLKVDLPPPA